MTETATAGPTSPAATRRPGGRSWAGFARRYGAAALLVLLLAYNALFTRNFLSWQTLMDVQLRQAAPVAIVALGMALVIATGGIDLSVGSVMAIAGQVGALTVLGGLPPALAVLLALAVAAACGVFNGTLVVRYGVQPIIATLILFISGRGIALVLTNGNLQTFSNPAFSYLGTGRILGLPFQGWLALGIALVVWWAIARTAFGRYLLAIGGNERAARLAGAPVRRIKIGAYVICSVLAGLAGLIVVAINSASDAARNGNLMELDAIAAAVVGGALLQGGRAPIFGVLLGAVIIQLVRYTLLANGIEDEVALIVKAAIIVLAVWLQQWRRA